MPPGLGGEILLVIPVRPESTLEETRVPALGDPRAVPVVVFRPGDLKAPKFFALCKEAFGYENLFVSTPFPPPILFPYPNCPCPLGLLLKLVAVNLDEVRVF
jgi:hypothetical protein